MNDGQSGGPDPVEALRLLANKEKDRKVPVSEIISSACALVLALEPAERADGLSASARRIRGRLWTLLSRPEKLPFGQLDAFGEFAGELQQLYGGYLSYAEDAPLLYPDAFPTAEVPRGLSRMQWRALVRESGMLQVLAAGRTGRDGLIAAIELAENVFGWCADRQELSNGGRILLALPLANLGVALQVPSPPNEPCRVPRQTKQRPHASRGSVRWRPESAELHKSEEALGATIGRLSLRPSRHRRSRAGCKTAHQARSGGRGRTVK
mmetsp:Transcript_12967/g.30400  ORF Transcript_12967/g.30400 Transcript_12967/m.30400 type:complete len:267 (+) Transcript_12967:35-835(+)